MRKRQPKGRAMTPRQLEDAITNVLRHEGFKFTSNRLLDRIINIDHAVKEKIELNVTEFANLLHEELKL